MAERNDLFFTRAWFTKIERMISILAKFAVIIGIIFAFFQIIQSNRIERRSIAIETVKQTRSKEFIKAYTRLKTAYKSKQIKDQYSLIDDINYIMIIYDNIANLYINNLADKCIIKKSVYFAVRDFTPILDFMEYPTEYRENFVIFKNSMERINCE